MANLPQDRSKRVTNQLFSASVTGSTFEEYSQNALLLPAVSTVPHIQQSNSPFDAQAQLTTTTADVNTATNFYQPEVSYSHSSFPYSTAPTNVTSPVINVPQNTQEGNNLSAVQAPLLFSPNQAHAPIGPPLNQGNVNQYRRTNQRRPVYAQIPGLSSGHAPVIPNQILTNYVEPQSIASPTLSPNESLNSAFQEISFNETNPQIKTAHHESYTRSELTVNPAVQEQKSTNIYTPVLTPISMNEMANDPRTAFAQSFGSPTGDTAMASNLPLYRPVYHHWFHKLEVEGRTLWEPFSMSDSLALESAFTSAELFPDKMVATDGGRYDVNILRRERKAVYWKSNATEVRRCSWFYKNIDGKYTPFDENISTKLEEEYKIAYESRQWPRTVEMQNNENILMQSPDILILNTTPTPQEMWSTANQTPVRPKIVKRGLDEFEIDEGEPEKIDHLLFLVHGIGSKCDLKFRTVEEVVDEFRSISLQLVKSHYRSSCEQGVVNRIEVLPIRWHDQLHSEDTGIDKKLKNITLNSIPRLREFTNETVLDVLFYNSPVYCQTIIGAVGGELNRIYNLFKSRNPTFTGAVSLGGHSLGSLILFDILCHQQSNSEKEEDIPEETEVKPSEVVKKPHPSQRQLSKRISYMMGKSGTGQPELQYPHLNFHPIAFFALGSPIGMFVTVRGLESLGKDFALPTCSSFYNIFHPFDPVAYRIESLVNPELGDLRPVLIPHHKGRKRMHLELKETMTRVGADLKAKIIESVKSTWNSFYQLAMFHKTDNQALEDEMDKVLEEQLNNEHQERKNSLGMLSVHDEEAETHLSCGMLNGGKRIDYVLQEAPIEMFNEYIFALTSHVCYWQSEDTMLLMLKVIYDSMNVKTDNQIPQQTMTIERPQEYSSSSSNFNGCANTNLAGMDPSINTNYRTILEPPPLSGFMHKTE